MAAPIFSQAEIDYLIAMPKVTPLKAISRIDSHGAKRERLRHPGTAERVHIMKVEPQNVANDTSFLVEFARNLESGSFAITLYAEMKPRPRTAIVRYDVHDAVHHNPSWAQPPSIEPGVLHRHIYSERGERESNDWCRVAEPLDVKSTSTIESDIRVLKDRFLNDMHIHFSDKEEPNTLFGPEGL